ncbi:zinc finger protein 142 isoform X1 [Pygocentrus nattereri]|uniref:C2H2-type domain-containing protein n=2 Tax=Pygocentrus nattereri TaxID=42514 RepID=A0A3B4DXP5_PYGNA|nr:zinc finger protein 142 isoform X1 [Pygocentrus nattereri]XP_017547113.1 zinc finger protein 142 isoform X1 [Pygocentrus nattereri]XP_017547115.1 zinc finger protein 142 isoform X1 [Pygocentrus nattereri]XP_037395256.1 zinc finger protein 142 isoform X1 [Pygocentrus nattereri]
MHLSTSLQGFTTGVSLLERMEERKVSLRDEDQLHHSLQHEKAVTNRVHYQENIVMQDDVHDMLCEKNKSGTPKKQKEKRRKVQNSSSALSQSKKTDVQNPQPQVQKNPSRRGEASLLSGKMSVHSVQDHVEEGAEHMFRTHICTECRRCFKTRSHLMEHMRLHFPDPSLQCPTCKHYFTSKSKLRVHMLRESGEKLHRCHLCDYGAVERNTLRRHLISVHGNLGEDDGAMDLYMCPTCRKGFRQSQELKSHMKSHHMTHDGQPLPCIKVGCPFQCTEKKVLQKHLFDAHSIKAIECRHHACSALFGCKTDMEAHFLTHKAFHCTHCDFTCSNKSRFQQHKRQGHAGDTQLSCDFCSFTTFNPVEFDQHVGHLHASEKTHRCQECSFVTAHKRVLKRHMLMHTGEKPHKCTLCEFRCRDETYLSKHMLTHSDDKQHMCSECGYVTKWKHYLNVHMRKHTGDLRYKCNECMYRCHRIDQLNSHKLRHQAKSLICEVCAYSCKRKTELHKHMQLKHSTSKDHQPPLYQCKFCAYTTKYRQALHNHENCKHTRTREFRCALCSYSTFSNTGLFLHKRKAHGYVPGDVKWLETYAEKERQNNSMDLMQTFYSKVVGTEKIAEEQGGSEGHSKTSNQVELQNAIMTNDDQIPNSCERVNDSESISTVLEHQGSSDVNSFGDKTNNETEQPVKIRQLQPVVPDQEECCILTQITCNVSAQAAPLRTESEDQGITDVPVDSFPRPDSSCNIPEIPVESVSEEEDDALSDPEEGSDSKEQGNRGNVIMQEVPQSSVAHHAVSSLVSSVDGAGSENLLQVMRRRDKDQADALILEGRVQMLVVQTQNNIYQCDHCSYVTRKQAALMRHCRSSCQVMKAALQCQDCGLRFKQLRSFNTHRLRKCLALQKKKKILSVVETSHKIRDFGTTQAQDTLHNKNEAARPLSPVTEADQCGDCVLTSLTGDKGANVIPQKNNTNHASESLGLATVDSCGYHEDNYKFTCKICSFSCSRKATIDRHCAACFRSRAQSKLTVNEQEDEQSELDCEQEEQDGENNEGDPGEKIVKSIKRFSCPNCPFVCQQRRALTSHEKRGCLKPGEIQCQQCSFVAKSEKSLNHHFLVHSKDKDFKRGKRARLHCKLCIFTCKQERCMAQHVALKHEGARPFHCRFCDFSTARRHRLDAHESRHTGIGRHCCELCGQSFGTSSKLRLHHQRIHDRQATHFCSLCDYKGYNPTDISRHTLSCHTGELSHPCNQCDARFSSDIALKQHCKRTHQAASSQRCTQCSLTCNSKARLKAHVQREHSQNNNVVSQVNSDSQLESRCKVTLTQKCPDCPFTTGKRLLLVQHILDEHEGGHQEEKTLKCDVCGFSCFHQLVFDQHIRSHGGTCLYKCTECNFSTRNRQKITWHMRIHTGEKPYQCEKCSYTCAEPSRLKYHMRIHQDERKYLCPECGYKCKWVNQLKYHMTKHSGAKSYACEECEYRTNRADALRVHCETRHRDVRSFICEKCGKAFKTRFLLKTHQKKHSDERPYVCSICQKGFRWPAGLRHHYLSHTNQLPFRCLYCSYRAKQKFQVVKHLRRHHPDQPVQGGVDKDPDTHTVPLQEARLMPKEDLLMDGQCIAEKDTE